MNDLDRTTTQKQWVKIIRRRAVMLIQAVQKVSDAIRGETPEQISALRREAFVALLRLCEASPHDIRGGLREDFQDEMDSLENK